MTQVSFFKTAIYNRGISPVLYPYRYVELEEIFEHIKNGGFKKILHKYYTNQTVKQELPNFTPSGMFEKRARNGEKYLIKYSRIIHLDFDKLEDISNVIERLKSDNYVYAFFKSPSMKGLKVFVKVSSGSQFHKTAWDQVRNYFYDRYKLLSDRACKDITRICFISSDPGLYINQNSSVFEVLINQIQPDLFKPVAGNEFGKVANYLIDFTSKKLGNYIGSERNNWLFTLACNCNRYGVSQSEAEAIVYDLFSRGDTSEFSENEIKKLVQSAYQYSHEHAKFKLPAGL